MKQSVTRASWCRLCHTVLKVQSPNMKPSLADRLSLLQSCTFVTRTPVNHSAKVQKKVTPTETPAKHTTGLKVENPYTEENITQEDSLVQNLFNGLKSSQRAALAKSITLVESTHPRKRAQSQVLLSLILSHNQKMRGKSLRRTTSFRIGRYSLLINHAGTTSKCLILESYPQTYRPDSTLKVCFKNKYNRSSHTITFIWIKPSILCSPNPASQKIFMCAVVARHRGIGIFMTFSTRPLPT